MSESKENCFIPFKALPQTTPPTHFTFPFNYSPHPLCIRASQELQAYIECHTELDHNFGLDNDRADALGKMFGVLVVKSQQNEIGYLAAYSGKLGRRNDHPHFVPPIVDLLDEEGFYRKGEHQISLMTAEISVLEKNPIYLNLKKRYDTDKSLSEEILKGMKSGLKASKKDRKRQREEGQKSLSPDEFEHLKERLVKESLEGQYAFKHAKRTWQERLTQRKEELDHYLTPLTQLKRERKLKSADLQNQIFERFSFLNYNKEEKSLLQIFQQTPEKIPPGGAGECAAPKLLQFAYQNGYQPLAMAEFWWGKSPKQEIRRHGQFYPSCRRKCEPILGYMLEGLEVEPNPMLRNPAEGKELDIVYDDEHLVVINKPAEFLSVPGKNIQDSVYSRIKHQYIKAEGPIIVHRLDMSTSGLMVLAKSKKVHQHLQEQFLNRTVKKYYVALLDGTIQGEEGMIDLPLRVDLDNRPQQMVCYEHGKKALTQWKVLERKDGTTRIQFYPITGRTHQLRVHSAHPDGLDTPIVGDDIYGVRGERLCLHAKYLKFTHPITQKTIAFNVDPDF